MWGLVPVLMGLLPYSKTKLAAGFFFFFSFLFFSFLFFSFLFFSFSFSFLILLLFLETGLSYLVEIYGRNPVFDSIYALTQPQTPSQGKMICCTLG